MNTFIVILMATIVAADVSHLTGPHREYLPPSQGGIQQGGQFGSGSPLTGQFGGHLTGSGGQSYGSIGYQGSSSSYGGSQGIGQYDTGTSGRYGATGANRFGGFGGNQIQIPSTEYLAPHQSSQFEGQHNLQFDRGDGRVRGSQFQPRNEYLSPIGGGRRTNFGDIVPGHTLGDDGYRYRSPNY